MKKISNSSWKFQVFSFFPYYSKSGIKLERILSSPCVSLLCEDKVLDFINDVYLNSDKNNKSDISHLYSKRPQRCVDGIMKTATEMCWCLKESTILFIMKECLIIGSYHSRICLVYLNSSRNTCTQCHSHKYKAKYQIQDNFSKCKAKYNN